METVAINTSQNVVIDYEVAGLGDRILARLIDIGILFLLYLLAIAAMSSSPRDISMVVYIFLGISVFYDLIFEVAFNGQSFGKQLMKIRVISLDGGQPTLGQYLIRWVFRIVDFLITFQLGALIAVIVSPKKQRIGDIAAGTTLIKTTPRPTIEQFAFAEYDGDYKPKYPQAIELSDADIHLIQDVISNYSSSGNYHLVSNLAARIRTHLNLTGGTDYDDVAFLETILKDHSVMLMEQNP